MLTRSLLFLLLALALPASAQTLDKIQKSGTLTLGYVDNAAPFAYLDANKEPQGYSIDLCRAVADSIGAQLKRPNLKTRWVKLTLQNRIDAVRKGQVDIECGTATWTLGRQRLVDFSLITFVDGGSVLTRLQDEGMRRLSDFDQKRIAVIGGTTTEKALREGLARALVQTQVVLVKAREEGLDMLRQGQVDGFASDRTTLIGIVSRRASGDAFRLLDADFSIEQYALMLPRGDTDFRLAVNRGLARLYRSGDVQKVYDRWLGPLGPPSVLLSATYFIQSLSE
ncbi:MAG TPA: amino acid ABC transporter substrate-binding protein [Burkholderiales bacterium]|jgi:ABC-type amino acid transport substrate-binding protein|nr:amino acid ABC transporter substrate-binding protein [Burkholderiales bacterium]